MEWRGEGSVGHILKALVIDLNRLHERVSGLETSYIPRFGSIQHDLAVLSANIQGFDSHKSDFRDQQAGENVHLNVSCAPILNPPRNVSLGARMLVDSVPLGLARRRAKQRWHWALMKLRVLRIRERVPMNIVRLGKSRSVVSRLKQVEGIIERTNLKLRHMLAYAGPKRVVSLMRATEELKETLAGGPGVLNRLFSLERKCDDVLKIATAADECSKGVLGDLETFKESFQSIAEDAAFAVENTKHLRKKAEEAALQGSLSRARTVAVKLAGALQNACFEATQSQKGTLDLENCLLPLCHQLEKITLPRGVVPDSWQARAVETAQFLYEKLRAEAPNPTVTTLRDISVGKLDGPATGQEANLISEIIGNCESAHALAQACLRSLANAIALDPDEVTAMRGMLSLEVWFSGSRGPEGQSAHTRLLASEAVLLAIQAELSSLPGSIDMEALSRRIAVIEDSIDKQQLTTTNEFKKDERTQLLYNEIEQFRSALTDNSLSIEKIQLELATKAGQEDTLKNLDRLRLEIVELSAITVGKQQFQTMLKSKIDHRDLRHVATLIANGELGGLKAAVAAKLQHPSFRCLCCDKPLMTCSNHTTQDSGSNSVLVDSDAKVAGRSLPTLLVCQSHKRLFESDANKSSLLPGSAVAKHPNKLVPKRI